MADDNNDAAQAAADNEDPKNENADPNDRQDEEKELIPPPKPVDITDSSDIQTKIEENTPNKTCCCCFPARSGIQLINCFSVFLLVVYIIITILLFFNDQIDWWFALVNMIVVASFGIAAITLIARYWLSPTRKSAKGLSVAMLLIAFMNLLLNIWNITYMKQFQSENVTFGFKTNSTSTSTDIND